MTTRLIVAVVVACITGIALTVVLVVHRDSPVQHKQYAPSMTPQEEWGS